MFSCYRLGYLVVIPLSDIQRFPGICWVSAKLTGSFVCLRGVSNLHRAGFFPGFRQPGFGLNGATWDFIPGSHTAGSDWMARLPVLYSMGYGAGSYAPYPAGAS